MTQGFFLNPPLIKEILAWYSNTGENLLVFEPIAHACAAIGPLLAQGNEKKSNLAIKTMEDWCASSEFHSMLSEAAKKNSSIGVSLARESLALISNSDSFVAGIPVYEVLSAFSALIRAELRNRESRCSVRIDELFIFQAQFKQFNLHDITLLLAASCASKNVLTVFDRLLQIKEDPGTHKQIERDSLAANICAEFASGLRMFALSNFDAAQTAFELSIKKDESPSAFIAMSLLHLLRGEAELVEEFAQKAASRTDSALPEGIKKISKMLFSGEEVEAWSDDPVCVAATIFLLVSSRQYEKVTSIADQHLKKFPADLVVQALWAESIVAPIRNQLFNDPPLSGQIDSEQLEKLREARGLLIGVWQEANNQKLEAMQAIANLNLSTTALASHEFISASESALAASEAGSSQAKINYATAMLATGDLPKLMRSLEGVSGELKKNALYLTAEAYYHACSFEQAAMIWNDLLRVETDRLWQLRLNCRMLEAFRLLRDTKNAQICVDTLLSEYKNEPEALFAIAYELWQLGRNEDAIHALKIGKKIAAPNLQKWMAWELGRVLFDSDQVLSATDEYVSIAEQDTDSVQAREFAVALYKAGLIPAACERARQIREVNRKVVPGITEIETDYLVREQKLEEAKELLLMLSKERPLSAMNRLAIVRICLSLGQEDEAREELKKLSELALSDEMRADVERFAVDLDLVQTIKDQQSK